MTPDFLAGLAAIFNIGWTILTCFHIPGTNVTPAALLMFPLIVTLSLKFLSALFLGVRTDVPEQRGKVSRSTKASKGSSK